MKLSNNGRDGASTGHLFSANKAYSTENDLHLTELLAIGNLWESTNNPGSYKCYRMLSTNWQEDPIAEDNSYTTNWMCNSLTRAYVNSFLLCDSMFGIRYSTCYHKRNINTNPAKNLSEYNGVLSARCTTAVLTKLMGIINIYLIWLRPITKDGTHSWSCLVDQEPETVQPKDLD